jgi:hypothetical protein
MINCFANSSMGVLKPSSCWALDYPLDHFPGGESRNFALPVSSVVRFTLTRFEIKKIAINMLEQKPNNIGKTVVIRA